MIQFFNYASLLKATCFMFFLASSNDILSQVSQQENMRKLDFMIGDWVGISKTFQNDTVAKEVPAYEKISYSLDSNIVTIDLKSEILQLHTVINYDVKDEIFSYHVFYQGGAAKYQAEMVDEKFIVKPNESKRFIFHLTSEGNFQEYGEKLENGVWIKYFEDTFSKQQQK